MKRLHFVMLGGKKYVDKCMSDEFITDNLLRNIRGAAKIKGKIDITVSDKDSQKELIKRFAVLGLSEEEMGVVSFTMDMDLMKILETSMSDNKDFYAKILGVRNSGDRVRFAVYADNLKLLSIYNAPKGQVVELVDLDQQVDIAKNPDFKVAGDEVLYTSMHFGQHSRHPSYRRHDMDQEEFIEHCKKYRGNVDKLSYTNERSYMVGTGKDERILAVVTASIKLPHFFAVARAVVDKKPGIPREEIFDAAMSDSVRAEMIKRFHLPFGETSLLEREITGGVEVPFERLGKSVKVEKPKSELKKPIPEVDVHKFDDALPGVVDEVFSERIGLAIHHHGTRFDGSLTIGDNLVAIGNQRESATPPNSSIEQMALVGTLAALAARFFANKLGFGEKTGGGAKGRDK
jgi:hypothetical protein